MTRRPASTLSFNGRPKFRPESTEFVTKGGIEIKRVVDDVAIDKTDTIFAQLAEDLNTHRGCLFESAYEFPGRYSRWTMGFKDPLIKIEGFNVSRKIKISALNAKGAVVLCIFKSILQECVAVSSLLEDATCSFGCLDIKVKDVEGFFSEEDRSKQNSLFSIVREIIAAFAVEIHEDPQLGLYGAFGYDLTFQFESVKLYQQRDEFQRDLVLYLPDVIFVNDRQLSKTWKLSYEFSFNGVSTKDIESATQTPTVTQKCFFNGKERDHEKGEYSEKVKLAKEEFKCGNLFEVVLSQSFSKDLSNSKVRPSELFSRIRKKNPSPYLFLINLDEDEFLIGASPEMFVRAEKFLNEDGSFETRIESCPISGTIKRGKDALEDAERIKEILSNKKEESELTMCTDVDRNDKSRICKHGTVQVVGRRQIEKYSRLIHTVDHVTGVLRPEYDALDAFLAHTWAVTVTGAPKQWAIQFIEKNEKSRRKWYGGAVGFLGFDGGMNTGMTLRTTHLQNGVASVRAGATLLFDSDPQSEEKETELKASALVDVLRDDFVLEENKIYKSSVVGDDRFKVLVVDHEDSFVNTLASYIRELGAEVITVRFSKISKEFLVALKPDLAVMSPGPGNPSTFNCSNTISLLIDAKIPIFGVCLGLQAITEHFGGKLATLGYPMHGKPTEIRSEIDTEGTIFEGLPETFSVGRYHSLYADLKYFPKELEVISRTVSDDDKDEKIVMALQHRSLPIAGVQFHPESIMTSPEFGLQILRNAMDNLKF